MADYPPFMNAYGSIPRILNRIKEAQTPPRFTIDFLQTGLGFSGGSYRPFIPLAKRLGLLASDGTPTDIYRAFRNPSESKQAIARAIRRGYAGLFAKNEYVYKADKAKLEGLVIEATGLERGHATVRAIVGTFEALKAFSQFEGTEEEADATEPTKVEPQVPARTGREERDRSALRLSYSVYLNLPNTTDINVFNAIFRSLRENLLD